MIFGIPYRHFWQGKQDYPLYKSVGQWWNLSAMKDRVDETRSISPADEPLAAVLF